MKRRMRLRRLAFAFVAFAVGNSALAQPWRLYRSLPTPPWLQVGIEQRLRFEHIENDFHRGAVENSSAVFLRSLLSAQASWSPLTASVEIIDARAYATANAPLNTTMVDTVDLLRATVGFRLTNVFDDADELAIDLGRMTLDVGSRRLVARNEFRNSINAFTGVDLRWSSQNQHAVRLFVVVPVRRLPNDSPSIANNAVQLDVENFDTWLVGLVDRSPLLFQLFHLELYALGLWESDRRLLTPGIRLFRLSEIRSFDFQFEAAAQLGTSRPDGTSLESVTHLHRATTIHASMGYRFGFAGTPRLSAMYDAASGDTSPNDTFNERFDPLFGARRFEFGPTGLYGLLARSNIASPGLRLDVTPHRTIDGIVAWRPAWVTLSGFLGHQIEGRVRWHPWPGNLSFEVGAATMQGGDLILYDGVQRVLQPVYFYSQVSGAI